MHTGSSTPTLNLFLGLDLGTSGCRACAINTEGEIEATSEQAWPLPDRNQNHSEQDPQIWWKTVVSVLKQLLTLIPAERIRAIAVDGTSSTLLLTDQKGRPLGPALMYDDTRSRKEAAFLTEKSIASCTPDPLPPQQSACLGANSSLAKLLHLYNQTSYNNKNACHALHQSDWVCAKLSGRFDISDENNCLKLGYDPVERRWPDWLDEIGLPADLFPTPKVPGSEIGPISEPARKELGLPKQTRIIAGTTDSTAAFLATGASKIGEAVSSLGSTLVMKVLSDKPVFVPEYGVYSHRLGNRWLVGGASNSGGAVLLKYFSQKQLDEMTPMLDPENPTGLDYYPLIKNGERFPINDPDLNPRLAPRPNDDLQFFQGMLEGMAKIEADAYRLLKSLGAPYPAKLFSVGGGSVNQAWQKLREKELGVLIVSPRHHEAAYGAAMLALNS